jgi:hypothetical protein
MRATWCLSKTQQKILRLIVRVQGLTKQNNNLRLAQGLMIALKIQASKLRVHQCTTHLLRSLKTARQGWTTLRAIEVTKSIKT